MVKRYIAVTSLHVQHLAAGPEPQSLAFTWPALALLGLIGGLTWRVVKKL